MPPGGHLLPHQPMTTIDEYLATDIGGLGVARAQEIGPAATIEMSQRSGLRGRGGGGFPTGQKWSGVAGQDATRRYLVCNGAEGEPGTFKDRALHARQPVPARRGPRHRGVRRRRREAFIGVKARFDAESRRARRAPSRRCSRPASARDCTGHHRGRPRRVPVRRGEGAARGDRGQRPAAALAAALPARPVRDRPRRPAGQAAATSRIAEARRVEPDAGQQRRDAGQRAAHPRPRRRLVPLDGHRGVAGHRSSARSSATSSRPGVGEVELGTPLRERASTTVGGGVRDGRHGEGGVLRRRQPGGHRRPTSTCPSATRASQAIGSGMGAGGFIVYDDTACMVEVARMFSRFLYVESCGQCPRVQARLGRDHRAPRTHRPGGNGSDDDIAEIAQLARQGHRRQPLLPRRRGAGAGRQHPARVRATSSPSTSTRPLPPSRRLPFPKIVDLSEGMVIYDPRVPFKQPDWTYAGEPRFTT